MTLHRALLVTQGGMREPSKCNWCPFQRVSFRCLFWFRAFFLLLLSVCLSNWFSFGPAFDFPFLFPFYFAFYIPSEPGASPRSRYSLDSRARVKQAGQLTESSRRPGAASGRALVRRKVWTPDGSGMDGLSTLSDFYVVSCPKQGRTE